MVWKLNPPIFANLKTIWTNHKWKNFFVLFLGFCGLFFSNGSKAAEKINIKFEEMEIPLTIEQLTKLEKYKDDSTELIDWLKRNGLIKIFELSKFLEFPVFKEEGLNREILRSWICLLYTSDAADE